MFQDPNQKQKNSQQNSSAGHGVPQDSYRNPPGPSGVPQPPFGTPEHPYSSPPPPPAGAPPTPYGYGAPPPYYPPPYQQGVSYGFPPAPTVPPPSGNILVQLPRQYLKVVVKPLATTFAEEMGKANWGVIWLQLIVLSIVIAVVSFTQGTPSLYADPARALGETVGRSLILGPLVFLLGQGILYLLAKAVGGQGKFFTQGYTTLLFLTPLVLISALLSSLPYRVLPFPFLTIASFALLIFTLALFIYGIVLQVLAIRAVHHLSRGKATTVVLIPTGVLLALVICIFFAALASIAPQH